MDDRWIFSAKDVAMIDVDGNTDNLGYSDTIGMRESRYLLTVTLFGNGGLTKTVTVSRVSL